VLGFLGRHAQPVEVIRPRHAREAPDRVQRQVDGVELDVADRVDQDGAPLGRGGRAAPDLRVGQEERPFGVAGQLVSGDGGCVKCYLKRSCLRLQIKRLSWFFINIRQFQQFEGAGAKLHPYNCSFGSDVEMQRDGDL